MLLVRSPEPPASRSLYLCNWRILRKEKKQKSNKTHKMTVQVRAKERSEKQLAKAFGQVNIVKVEQLNICGLYRPQDPGGPWCLKTPLLRVNS
ncbi:hypothetical protein GN956_G14194 [Arapaima gigas]